MSVPITFTEKELEHISSALRLRADACFENCEDEYALNWIQLESKLKLFLLDGRKTTETTTTKTLKELADDSLSVQNACNLSGVAQGFARAMIQLNEHVRGTIERNTHPITRMWVDKLSSLAGIQNLNQAQNDDYLEEVERIAERMLYP